MRTAILLLLPALCHAGDTADVTVTINIPATVQLSSAAMAADPAFNVTTDTTTGVTTVTAQ